MAKGDESSIMFAAGVLIFIAVVAIVIVVLAGGKIKYEIPGEGVQKNVACEADKDCADNADGLACIQLGSTKGITSLFCGCRTGENCKSGLCGRDNMCVEKPALPP